MTRVEKALPTGSVVIPLMFFSQKPAKSKQLRLRRTPPCISLMLERSQSVLSRINADKCVPIASVSSLVLNNIQEVPECLRRMGRCCTNGTVPWKLVSTLIIGTDSVNTVLLISVNNSPLSLQGHSHHMFIQPQ